MQSFGEVMSLMPNISSRKCPDHARFFTLAETLVNDARRTEAIADG